MADERNGYIAVEGMEQISRALASTDKRLVEAAMKGLEVAAFNIVADAQKNLRRNGNNVSGLLWQSGHAERRGDEVTAGFFDTQNKNTKGHGIGGVMNSVAEAVRKALRHSTASFAATARSIRQTPAQQ